MVVNRNSTNKRDILLITILLLIVGGIFLYIQLFQATGEANYAHVYYGTSDQPLVTIDFIKNEVVKYNNQEVPSAYGSFPVIDEGKRTITLLGDYEINGVRQIVVIEYDFGLKTVQIIEEESPNHICSKEGVSTGKPLICLPNRVRVEFETNDDADFTV